MAQVHYSRISLRAQVLASMPYSFRELSRFNYDQVLYLEHRIVWLRDLDTRKIEEEIFSELRNVVLEENGEDKMVRVSN